MAQATGISWLAAWLGALSLPAAQAQHPLPEPRVATVQSADNPVDVPIEAAPASLSYALGGYVTSGDLQHLQNDLRLRPMVGLRYGRWRAGPTASDEWLRFNSFRQESTLGYDKLDTEHLKWGFSLRQQNLSKQDGLEAIFSGKRTVRGGISATWLRGNHWALGMDLTHDLLNKGDGNTFSVGVSHAWPADADGHFNLNAGVTWANAEHWRTAYAFAPTQPQVWHSGFQSLAAGVSYRRRIDTHWLWYVSLNSSRPLGQAERFVSAPLIWGSEAGLLYFSR